jgi:hypothetical protein
MFVYLFFGMFVYLFFGQNILDKYALLIAQIGYLKWRGSAFMIRESDV